jgi:phosphoglucomutase
MMTTDETRIQAMERYKQWLRHPLLQEELKAELLTIEGDTDEIIDRFYRSLEFGTGGLRGVIGAGTNRLNIHTIRKAAQGLANVVRQSGEDATRRGIVIAHDSRRMSPEFTLEAAKVLATSGVQAYIFDGLRPTPLLSFAVRMLHAFGGVVVTASHNPPEYNGFKVYGEDGGQIPPHIADHMLQEMEALTNPLDLQPWSKEQALESGWLQILDGRIDEAYQEKLQELLLHPNELPRWSQRVSMVYTPLHGTGHIPVKEALKRAGFAQVHIVEEQAEPDSEFSTVASPNPEEPEAFALAMDLASRIQADILMATDPDTDRMGLAVKNDQGKYQILSGNQTGALLLDYLLSQQKHLGILPANGVVLKTIVTSEIGRALASKYGLETVDTLTGFKFIGEKIAEYEADGTKKFVFGYEESYGYLAGDFVRDKDAVQACLVAAEMAAYHHAEGRTLWSRLQEIYQELGHYRESLQGITLKGIEGAEKIQNMLAYFREHPPAELAGKAVVTVEDYLTGKRKDLISNEEAAITLPSSNVLKYTLTDHSWFCLRPSGTEPKLKLYFSVHAATASEADGKLNALQEEVMRQVQEQLQA